MERLLILLALFLPALSFGATPAGVPMITMAANGQQTQALSIPLASLSGTGVNGVFSLFSGNNSAATAGDYYPLYKNGAAYQVSSGKSAYCFNATASDGSGSDHFQFVTATASFTFGQSSALTGGVYFCGAAGTHCLSTGPSSYVPVPVAGIWVFGSSTYVGWQAGNSVTYNIHLDCFEQ